MWTCEPAENLALRQRKTGAVLKAQQKNGGQRQQRSKNQQTWQNPKRTKGVARTLDLLLCLATDGGWSDVGEREIASNGDFGRFGKPRRQTGASPIQTTTTKVPKHIAICYCSSESDGKRTATLANRRRFCCKDRS